MGLIYGESTWTVCLSTAESAGAPSGDYLYCFTSQFDEQISTNDKNKSIPSWNKIKIPLGKGTMKFTLNVFFPAITQSDENTVRQYIFNWIKSFTTIYLWRQRGGTFATYYDITTAAYQYYVKIVIRDVKFSIKREGIWAVMQCEQTK